MIALDHHTARAGDQGAIRAGSNAKLTRGPGGYSVSIGGAQKEWEHPWQTKLHWLGDLGQWVATVRPGFVNGEAPVVRTRAEVAKSLAGRFYNGLITARSGEDDIRRAAELASEDKKRFEFDGNIDVKLYNNPPVTLPMRSLGFDSGGGLGTAVPSFFRKLGVNESPTPATNGFTNAQAVVNSLNQTPPKGNRLLRAADIIVHQPRLALTSTVTLSPGIVTGISNVSQTLGLRSAAPGDRLLVRAVALWDPASDASFDPLAGDYEEPAYDELLVATVYFVSPPDAAPQSMPDEQWVGYVRHSLFWNLTYLPRTVLEVPQLDDSVGQLITLVNVLGGGTGGFAANFIAASLNDATQNAFNLITAHSMAGTWWTSTGGGSSSEFPAEMPAAAKQANGFDKAAAVQARRIAAARALKAMRLDPPFPYRAVPFTPSLLNS